METTILPASQDVLFFGGYPLFQNDIPQKINEKRKIDEKLKNELWTKVAPVDGNKSPNFGFNQIKTYTNEFLSQMEKKRSEYFRDVPLDDLLECFINSTRVLLSFSPKVMSIELTSSKSFFLFGMKDKTNIYLEIFFEDLTCEFSDVIVNIYENKIQKLAINGTLPKVAQEIEEYFQPTCNDYNYTLSNRIPRYTPSIVF